MFITELHRGSAGKGAPNVPTLSIKGNLVSAQQLRWTKSWKEAIGAEGTMRWQRTL